MTSQRIFSALAAFTSTAATFAVCAAAAVYGAPVHADPAFNAAAQRRVAADGNGNVRAAAGGGINTAAGGQGFRARSFDRSADGSASANGRSSVTTANGGSASTQASATRNADGSASAERNTTATNANTGVTFDSNTTYTKGSGFSRSASCKDASGNTVSCGSR